MQYALKLFTFFVLVSLAACKTTKDDPNTDPKGIEDLVISDNFNWSTASPATFRVQAYDNINQPVSGARINVFTADPLDGGQLIVSGVTNTSGVYLVEYEVPAYYDSLFVNTDFIGLPSPGMVALNQNGFDLILGGVQTRTAVKSTFSTKDLNTDFAYLGGYNSAGVPDYLEPVNDVITQSLLDDINNTLPERETLMESHPEYLLPEWDYNLNLLEDCDVWITFVHEGAGYKNVLGFYTYPTGNTPQSPEDIEEITVIYPNVSYQGSGGGLYSGNKVYIGQFSAGNTVSFALMSDGWRNGEVTDGRGIFYSNPNLNPESDPNLKQHTVLLNDNGRNLLLLGFEDINRSSSGCDHDFNDAIFYVTANPIEAIDQSQFPNIDYTGEDTDGDGVPNNVDNYPDDPNKAFDNYFFNKGSYGTLAFEDLWPDKGDYDFNDAVIDYNFNQITNADNHMVAIEAEFILRAHGAFYHNGFGFEMPFDKNLVASVTGDLFVTGNIVTLDDKNLESGQTLPVVIVWEDAYDVLPQEGGGIGVNTNPEYPYVSPDTLNITISLNSPVALSSSGIPPYNPFIFVNGQRDLEVHLVDKAPTGLANLALFGTGADDSDFETGRYYRTQSNLPWAINIIESFDYPVEKVDITSAYLKFGEWAESNGVLFPDWYKDEPGYRNEENIYQIPE
ncbi:MAG: LruC domain-containing protein [Bacteroidetes bacterium]|nr:LruC domain-containing protein [Bacteroidota bacterium]